MTRDSTASHLAKNIKRLRERRGLTQQDLAETSGVPRPTIANLESGSANPTLAVVLKVAETLGTTVEELVSDVGPRAVVHAAKTLPEKRRAGALLRKLIPEGFRPVEFERIEIAPGSRFAAKAETLGAREYLACESGDLNLVLGEDVLSVGTGDVASLTADQPRDYENRGRRGAVAYRILVTVALLLLSGAVGCAGTDSTGGYGEHGVGPATSYADPGTVPWTLVPKDRVADECKLDPAILEGISYNVPWLVVRYGKMCWAGGGALTDAPKQNFSATKTLGATTLGIVAYETRNIPRTGPKTGPVSDEDRADQWLDPLEITYNKEAHLAHVLAMEAHNTNLAFGQKQMSYDTVGSVQINSLSTVMKRAIAQDPSRLGADLPTFVQKFVFDPLGMKDSTWDTNDLSGLTGWFSTVGDMARLGLLLLHHGIYGGKQVLSPEWVYRMTHPSFEDGNNAYGYLTWLNSRANWNLAGLETFAIGRFTDTTIPLVGCAPAAIYDHYPHSLSEAPDCLYAPHATCEQQFDEGAFQANGLGGQLIVGMPGLDMIVVTRDFAGAVGEGVITMGDVLWKQIVPAVVAKDPVYAGDVNAFCAAYSASKYAPDLH